MFVILHEILCALQFLPRYKTLSSDNWKDQAKANKGREALQRFIQVKERNVVKCCCLRKKGFFLNTH